MKTVEGCPAEDFETAEQHNARSMQHSNPLLLALACLIAGSACATTASVDALRAGQQTQAAELQRLSAKIDKLDRDAAGQHAADKTPAATEALDSAAPYAYHPAPPNDGVSVPQQPAKLAPFSVKFSETGSHYPPGRIREVPCGEESTLHSERSALSVSIEFHNSGNSTTELLWLDYKGKRVSYNTLPPGKTYVQATFVTHPWILASKGKCRVILVSLEP